MMLKFGLWRPFNWIHFNCFLAFSATIPVLFPIWSISCLDSSLLLRVRLNGAIWWLDDHHLLLIMLLPPVLAAHHCKHLVVTRCNIALRWYEFLLLSRLSLSLIVLLLGPLFCHRQLDLSIGNFDVTHEFSVQWLSLELSGALLF